MPISLEKAILFADYALGFREVGVAEGESVTEARSPELRAFCQGVGETLPQATYRLAHHEKEKWKNFAQLLLDISDAIVEATNK